MLPIFGGSFIRNCCLLALLIISFWSLFPLCSSTLTPNSAKSSKSPKDAKLHKAKHGPIKEHVVHRSLVVESPLPVDILDNHESYYEDTQQYSFEGLSLGYVTPWNNHGYDVAKIFANKFTHISPVWLQLKRKETYEIGGTQDFDPGWIEDVTRAGQNRKVKITPRVIFEGFTGIDYASAFANPTEAQEMSRVLLEVCEKYNFGGLVFEFWSQIIDIVDRSIVVRLVQEIGKRFKLHSKELIIVIPPKRGGSNEVFGPEQFSQLYDYVTAFSLMTYDFSNPQRPGPNAPLKWIEDSILFLCPDEERRSKILTGLNFYGNDYTPSGGGPIIRHEYLSLLKNTKGQLTYDSRSHESFFEVKDGNKRHLVFYPTLYSIGKRLSLATTMGTGISIWELGQGLDYFYDLL